ncbi:unnamed protein product [Staurois parvus]|uniref:Ig-like domain-containing protein n=1 Tax=Staurois parvus TaxID=386267 RepID=A0ABN9C889_9NEOB|nr:unnamed protein product [Staurois parvus]
MTQSLESIVKSPGDTITIPCTSSEDLYHTNAKYITLSWYQQKQGKPISLLVQKATERYTGVPERFVGSGSGTNYHLTINGAKEEDEGSYYCMQHRKWPVTQ